MPRQLTPLQFRLILFFVVIACFALTACGLVLFVTLIADDQGADIQSLNQDRGNPSNPIPANEVVYFGNFNVLPLYYVRPATDLVRSFNVINRSPGSGREYILVRFKLECTQPSGHACKGSNFNVRIIDNQGQDWGRPFGILLNDNLEGEEFVSGVVVEGWQVFEFPQDRNLSLLKMWDDNNVTLYARLPSQRAQ